LPRRAGDNSPLLQLFSRPFRTKRFGDVADPTLKRWAILRCRFGTDPRCLCPAVLIAREGSPSGHATCEVLAVKRFVEPPPELLLSPWAAARRSFVVFEGAGSGKARVKVAP